MTIPSEGKALVKFEASWCQPCKMQSKILEGIKLDIPVIAIDIDEQSELATTYRIRGVPTMVLIDNGTEIKRKSGVMQSAELTNFIQGV
jgi:thioredoxin 1